MQRNDSYGFAATAKSSSVICQVSHTRNLDGSVCDLYTRFLYNILLRVSCTRNLDRLSGALKLILFLCCTFLNTQSTVSPTRIMKLPTLVGPHDCRRFSSGVITESICLQQYSQCTICVIWGFVWTLCPLAG